MSLKNYKAGIAKINTIFACAFLLEAMDFLMFDSSPVFSTAFAVIIGYQLILMAALKRYVFVLSTLILFFIVLVLNGSFNESPLKSTYFIFTLSVLVALLCSRRDESVVVVSNEGKFSILCSDITICLVFLLFSIDSLTYLSGVREFVVNPNQLGIWSATYLCFALLVNKCGTVVRVSKVNMVFAFFALLASGSKGAFFLIVLSSFLLLLFNSGAKRTGLIVLAYIGAILFLYSNIGLIDERLQALVNFKQSYIGGSGESSDIQRLVGVPLAVLTQLTSWPKILFGVGVNYSLDDFPYQAIIPHNAYFLVLSHLGVIGLCSLFFLIVGAIFRSQPKVAIFLAACLIFAGMTTSMYLSRGALYPFVMLLVAEFIKSVEISKNQRAIKNATTCSSRPLDAI
ncbi:hypothetical protein [Chromobacterium haemolyticum]|uniref:hypothetical protein n=1 Tax=Chromobacterium haemolyticum TaxID=394935 RepID=UPI001177558C|nr:hypothetical protein [Chromobacterium haemolyticum]